MEGMALKRSYLEGFALTAATGSISEAAKRLRLSQPALSRQVKMLEEALGLGLVVRTNRGIELTDDGRRFHETLAPLLRQFEALVAETNAERVEGEILCG